MASPLDAKRIAPLAIVLMGVSGSGKSTVGALLADRLGCAFLEGDDFHSAANIEKMRQGVALTDADRWPWLDALGASMNAEVARRGLVVASCSALRRVYRERLAAAAGAPMVFVLLDVAPDELERRLRARPGHFMPAALLDSQLRTLERPAHDEPAITLDGTEPAAALVEEVVGRLSVS